MENIEKHWKERLEKSGHTAEYAVTLLQTVKETVNLPSSEKACTNIYTAGILNFHSSIPQAITFRLQKYTGNSSCSFYETLTHFTGCYY